MHRDLHLPSTMVSFMSLSLLLLVSLAAAISAADADGHSSMNKNLRGVYYHDQTLSATSNAEIIVSPPAPAPCRHHLAAPSIRILQEEEDDVPTLSPVIVEYWGSLGDGIGNPNSPGEDVPDEDFVPIDQVEIVAVDDLTLSDTTVIDTTGTDTSLNDGEGGGQADTNDGEGAEAETDSVNDIEDDIDNNKTKSKNDSPKDDKKWVILVSVLSGAAFLLMFVLLVLVCRARRRNRRDEAARQAVNGGGSKSTSVTSAIAAAAARMTASHDAACDPTEMDQEFSEHPDIQEILTDSGKASDTSSV